MPRIMYGVVVGMGTYLWVAGESAKWIRERQSDFREPWRGFENKWRSVEIVS